LSTSEAGPAQTSAIAAVGPMTSSTPTRCPTETTDSRAEQPGVRFCVATSWRSALSSSVVGYARAQADPSRSLSRAGRSASLRRPT